MGAYEDVRDDVTKQYDEVLQRTGGGPYTEGLGSLSVPSITVSGSQPAWLGDAWRQALTVAALIGSLLGMGLMVWALGDDGGAASTVAGFGGGFAITAFVVAYFTVAGFGKAEFSIGSGDAADGGEQTSDSTTGNGTAAAR